MASFSDNSTTSAGGRTKSFADIFANRVFQQSTVFVFAASLYLCRFRGERWVIISIKALCDADAIIEHDERRPGLPNALVVMEHDNNKTKE